MESLWGNETIREFNVEADLHALNGHNFVGALVRFDAKKGDAAALAALGKLLPTVYPRSLGRSHVHIATHLWRFNDDETVSLILPQKEG